MHDADRLVIKKDQQAGAWPPLFCVGAIQRRGEFSGGVEQHELLARGWFVVALAIASAELAETFYQSLYFCFGAEISATPSVTFPILMLQGYNCQGIQLESYHLPTKGDFLQIGR
jgi:hypothetical protein